LDFYYKINNFPVRKLLILLKIKIFTGKKDFNLLIFLSFSCKKNLKR